MRNSYATARAYRETEVLSAPPGRLVVITFDGVLASLGSRPRRHRRCRTTRSRWPRSTRRAALLCQLLTSLDRERGGDIAARLFSLYLFVLGELLEISMRPDLARLDRNISLVRELRETFDQIASLPREQLS